MQIIQKDIINMNSSQDILKRVSLENKKMKVLVRFELHTIKMFPMYMVYSQMMQASTQALLGLPCRYFSDGQGGMLIQYCLSLIMLSKYNVYTCIALRLQKKLLGTNNQLSLTHLIVQQMIESRNKEGRNQSQHIVSLSKAQQINDASKINFQNKDNS